LERIAYQVGIYKIEKESQDDNRGNPDFEWKIPGKKDRPLGLGEIPYFSKFGGG